MSKRVPCNECREHKRGCSGEMPCQRCQRFNLKCVYTFNKSPKDEEYIQELALRQQMETLREQVAIMEKELDFLRVTQPTIVMNHHTSPLSKSSMFTSTSDTVSTVSHGSGFSPRHYTEQDSPSTTASDLSDGHHSASDNGRRLIARNNKGYFVTVDTATAATEKTIDPLDWTLTVSNGKLSIQTNIRNHNELFSNLQKIVSTLEFQDKVPALFDNSTEPNPIGKVLRFVMWKRYGKSRYKSMARSHRLLLMAANTRSSGSTVDGSTVTTQLLNAYFQCQHLLNIQIHRQTFLNLYVYDGRADFSPAAMALCAVVCMHPCRHVQMVIPGEQLMDYGRYYAERAQEALDDRFDEISLEIFVTYALLSLYKMRMAQVEDGVRYADIAERMAHILQKKYDLPDRMDELQQCDPEFVGKASLFHRAMQAVVRARMLGHIVLHNEAEEQQDHEKSKRQKMDYAKLHAKVHGENAKIRPVVGDSEDEVRYIRAFLYMQSLRLEAHKIVQGFQTNDILSFVGVFGHQLEMVMRYWYKEVLPPDYRLSVPLFDTRMTEEQFFEILDKDSTGNPVPLITTMRVYGEYLIMAKSYLPSTPEVRSFSDSKHSQGNKQQHIDKLLSIRQEVDFDGTDEEYLRSMFSAMRMDPKELRTSLADLSVRTTICGLRILRYVQQRSLPICFQNTLLVNDSWEVLKRIGRIYLFEDGTASDQTMELRNILESYCALATDIYASQPYGNDLGASIKSMKEDLDGELALLVPYHAKDPDFSYYLNI